MNIKKIKKIADKISDPVCSKLFKEFLEFYENHSELTFEQENHKTELGF